MKPETFIDPVAGEVTLIHFVVGESLACMPSLKTLHATSGVNQQRLVPHLRTGETSGVTCKVCRKTDAFAAAEANLRAALAKDRGRP